MTTTTTTTTTHEHNTIKHVEPLPTQQVPLQNFNILGPAFGAFPSSLCLPRAHEAIEHDSCQLEDLKPEASLNPKKYPDQVYQPCQGCQGFGQMPRFN